MPLPSLDACSYLNVCSATLDGANCTYPIELRWRTTPWDLRALWRLHELSFPISYPASYYHSLLNARDTAVMLISTTAAACAAAPRTGSSSIFSCKPPRDVKQKEQRRQAWPPHRTLWAKEVVDEWEEVAELISLMEDEAWSRSPSASTAVGELASQSDGTSQQQQQQQPTTSSSATEMGSSAATRGKDGAGEGDRDDDDVGNPDYMILVGFAIGGLAYGGRGNFFINPTGYLGSIAVEPWLRGSGLGDVLLSHFTHYLSTSFPVYAEDYLHYDAQRDYMAVINYRKRQACLAMKEMLNPPSTSTAKKVNGGGDGGGVGEVHVDDGDDEDAAAAATTSTNNNNNNNVPEYISDAELNKFLAELCDDEVEEIMAPRYLAGAVLGSCFPPRLPTWSYEQHRQRLKQRKESLKEALANPHHREARWLRHLASPAAMAELNPLLHRGVRTVWLHCLANQTGLVQFYNRHNFIRVRTLPNFYEFTDGSRHAATLMMFDADVESTLDRACYPGVEEDYDAALARCALDSLPVEVQGGGGDVMVRESDVAANDPANRLRLWREVDNTRHLNYMIRRQQWLNKTGDSWKATTSQPDFDGWMNEFPYWLSPAMYEVVQYLDPRQQNKSKEAWTSVCKTGWKPTDTPLGISPLVMWVYLGINALLIGGAFLLSFFARSETEEA